MEISRRDWLKGLMVGALGLVVYGMGLTEEEITVVDIETSTGYIIHTTNLRENLGWIRMSYQPIESGPGWLADCVTTTG